MALAPSPPLIPGTARLLQIAIHGKMHDQTTVNTFHVLVNSTAPGASGMASAAVNFWAGVRSQWCNAVSVDWTGTIYTVRMIGFPEIMPQQAALVAPFVGTIESQALPGVCAGIISKRSTFGGKRGRGRVYIAGVPENGAENGQLTEAQRVLMQDLADRFNDDFGWGDTGTATPYLWSRNVGGEAGVRGVAVSHAIADTVLGTQRRRRIGRGI